MAIFDLFSKRQKKLRGEVPDIYTYDEFPKRLKVQIIQIIRDAIGEGGYSFHNQPEEIYKNIHDTLCREYGRQKLGEDCNKSYEELIFDFLLTTPEIEEVIDVVELTFKNIDSIIKNDFNNYTSYNTIKIKPEDAYSELNTRFKENGVGYSFDGNKIIRVDSTYVHSEITKPVISLLSNNKFKGANEEYLKAHEHYKHGRNKECLTECLKAFESTLKVICKEKKWDYNQTYSAKKLIQVCFRNELVPTYTQNQYTSLLSLLESGIPTIRNKLSAHGQGQTPQSVDNEMARYGLNLAGTNIIFLVEQSGLK